MEIERKYLVKNLPENIENYDRHMLTQGYISTTPSVVRIRRWDNEYILTIKSQGLQERIEIEKALTIEEFGELSTMVIGNIISKIRYIIPINEGPASGLKIELDIFQDKFKGLIYAEVEFPDKETADIFIEPEFFGKEITTEPEFQNSSLSEMSPEKIKEFIDKANAMNK